MKFDKSKILTAVTADQAKVGQKGWVADNLTDLSRRVSECHPITIASITSESMEKRFIANANANSLFYPAPEPSYAERQAQWVKENNVKAGTNVRVTRTFTENQAGSRCLAHDDLVGKTGVVSEYSIFTHNLRVDMSDGSVRAIPYFALEVIKKPTYRPFNKDELRDLVGEVLTNKQSGRKKVVTGKPTASGVNLDGSYITAKDLLSRFYRNTNEPCGIKK